MSGNTVAQCYLPLCRHEGNTIELPEESQPVHSMQAILRTEVLHSLGIDLLTYIHCRSTFGRSPSYVEGSTIQHPKKSQTHAVCRSCLAHTLYLGEIQNIIHCQHNFGHLNKIRIVWVLVQDWSHFPNQGPKPSTAGQQKPLLAVLASHAKLRTEVSLDEPSAIPSLHI